MLVEKHFSNISRHQKPVDPEWAATVAEYLEKVGATDLDDPNAPKRKVQRTDAQLRELEGIEHAKAEKKAQAEYREAQANLANGTAVLRQKNERAKPATKAKKAKIAKDTTKPAKRAAKIVKKPAKPAKALTDAQVTSKKKRLINKLRRAEMTEVLKSGGAIEPIDWRGENLRAHQVQSYDLMMIGKTEGFSVVRVNKVGTRKMQFIVDKFERCNIPEPISCLIKGPDRAKLFELIGSGKLITVNDIKENVVAGGRTMTYLSRTYNVGIYSVVKSNKTVGWVMVDASELQVRTNNEVAAHAPTSTPHEILEAAYREFKRVAKDAGSTISEVLAVKEGQ